MKVLNHLPLHLLVYLCLSAGTLQAQNPDVPEIPRFSFSATAIGFDKTPPLYWLDFDYDMYGKEIREYKAFRIPVGSRSPRLEIPVRAPVHLYRKSTGEDGEDLYQPVFTLPNVEENVQILMILSRKPSGEMHVNYLDDDRDAHPGGTVRMANFSSQKAIARVNSRAEPLLPGAIKSLGTPDFERPGVFTFAYALQLDGRNFTAPKTRLKFASDRHRLLVILTYVPTYHDTGKVNKGGQVQRQLEYRPMAYQLFDRVPEEPAPGPEVE